MCGRGGGGGGGEELNRLARNVKLEREACHGKTVNGEMKDAGRF